MDFGSSSRFPLENHHQILSSSGSSYNYNNTDSRTDFEQQQQQQQQQQEEMESSCVFVEKEHMFDKVVTPSDVGKLNRLVIPKQHAEKYFPLDSSSNEKGLLLNFEDRCGKSWRFRYSYWTSSQSYVMTKGWSRFVKEKRLDAGDIVSFQRALGHVGKDRFFIDWRRRPAHAAVDTAINFHHHHPHHGATGHDQIPHHFQLHQWSPVATPLSLHRDHVLHLPQNNSNHNNVSLFHNNNPYGNNPYNHHYHHHNHPPIIATGGGGGGGGGSYGGSSVFYHLRSAPTPPQEEVPVVAGGGGGGIGKGSGTAKTLRLFGVNMECAVSEDQSDDECDITTSPTTMSPQFRVYNGMPMSIPMSIPMSMSIQMPNDNNMPTTDFFDKGKSSMSSLDFGT